MLLRRQTSYNQRFHTSLTFNPTTPGYQAGIVLWWSQYSYATVGIASKKSTSGDAVKSVTVRLPKGKAGTFEVRTPSAASLYMNCFIEISLGFYFGR